MSPGRAPDAVPRDRGIDAVLFDHDDTLVDWWGSWTDCVASLADDEVLDALAAHVRQACWQERPGGDGAIWHRNTWMVHALRHELWPAALPFLSSDEVTQLVDRFDDELWVRFFPDTIGVLEWLVDRYALGVVSNNPLLPAEVERLRLDRWFDVTLVAHPECKPHPTPFLKACAALGAEPQRTLFVGDSVKADVLGALDAGLVPVWLDRWSDPWPGKPRQVHRVASLIELRSLVEELDGAPAPASDAASDAGSGAG